MCHKYLQNLWMNVVIDWLTNGMNEWEKAIEESPVKWFQVSSFSDTISHFYNDHLSSGFIMIITGSLALMQPRPCLIFNIQAFASVFWVFYMCSCWPRCQSANNCYSSPSWEWGTCVADHLLSTQRTEGTLSCRTQIAGHRDFGQLHLNCKASNFAFWWNSVWLLG